MDRFLHTDDANVPKIYGLSEIMLNLDSKRNARFCTKLGSNEMLDFRLEWNGNLDCSNIYSNYYHILKRKSFSSKT